MEELMIEIMHEDNINMAWYSFIHEGIKCRGYVEFEEDEEENEAYVIRKIEEEKVWEKPALTSMSPFTQWLVCRCEDSGSLMNFYEPEDMESDLNNGLYTPEDLDAFENDSRNFYVESDYEIEKEDGRYRVHSHDASITIYASTLSQFNLDCTLRQAEEKLQHKEPMRRRGRVR